MLLSDKTDYAVLYIEAALSASEFLNGVILYGVQMMNGYEMLKPRNVLLTAYDIFLLGSGVSTFWHPFRT